MSETPNSKTSNANRRPPRKPKPRTDTAKSGQQASAPGAGQQNGKSKRRPAQKSRRPQNQNKNQGHQQRNADNFGNQAHNGNHANGNSFGANGNRKTPNGNRSQQNGRRPQNRNGNSWSQGTDSYGTHDQYRSSDWYREDQARFAAQQIAVERAEAGKSGGNQNNNQNKRNPRNRNNRNNRTNTTATASDGVQNNEQDTAPVPVVTNAAADTESNTDDAPAAATATEKSDSGKRETGKSRRAPWRTQKHAAGRKNDSDGNSEASEGSI